MKLGWLVHALALGTLGWIGCWLLLGEFGALRARTLGFGLIPIFAWSMLLFVAGGMRILILRGRFKRPPGSPVRLRVNGWNLAGLACLLTALVMLQLQSPGPPPDDLPRERLIEHYYSYVSRSTLLLAAGMALGGVGFLTKQPPKP